MFRQLLHQQVGPGPFGHRPVGVATSFENFQIPDDADADRHFFHALKDFAVAEMLQEFAGLRLLEKCKSIAQNTPAHMNRFWAEILNTWLDVK